MPLNQAQQRLSLLKSLEIKINEQGSTIERPEFIKDNVADSDFSGSACETEGRKLEL